MQARFIDLLLQQTIQITLVIAIALLVDRMLNRPRWSRYRYVLWLLVLIKMVTPPIFTSPTGVFSLALMTYEVPVDANDVVSSGWLGQFKSSVLGHAWLLQLTAMGWLAGIATLSLIWISRMRVATASAAQPGQQQQRCRQLIAELCEKMNVQPMPNVKITQSSFGPAVFGLFRPTVAIPLRVLEQLSDDQLRPILAHELVHVKRRDTWVGLLQLMAAILWWFHPLAWIAIRRVSNSLELATDDEVVQQGIDEHRYAGSLLAVIEVAHSNPPVTGTVGVFSCQVTESRIRRLIERKNGRPNRTASFILAILLACLILPGRGLTMVGEVFDARNIPTDVECPN